MSNEDYYEFDSEDYNEANKSKNKATPPRQQAHHHHFSSGGLALDPEVAEKAKIYRHDEPITETIEEDTKTQSEYYIVDQQPEGDILGKTLDQLSIEKAIN